LDGRQFGGEASLGESRQIRKNGWKSKKGEK